MTDGANNGERIDFGALGTGEVQTSPEVVEAVVVYPGEYDSFGSEVDEYSDGYAVTPDDSAEGWYPSVQAEDEPVAESLTRDVLWRSGKVTSHSEFTVMPGQPGHQEAVDRAMGRAGLVSGQSVADQPGTTNPKPAKLGWGKKQSDKQNAESQPAGSGENVVQERSDSILGSAAGKVALKGALRVATFSYMAGIMFVGLHTGVNTVGQIISFGHLGDSPYALRLSKSQLSEDIVYDSKLLLKSPYDTYKYAGRQLTRVVPGI